MYPKGIIYKKGFPARGEIYLQASLKVKILYSLIRGLGAGLIGFAIIAFLFTYGPIIQEELQYRLNSLKPSQTQTVTTNLIDNIEAQKTNEVRAEAQALGIDPYFSLNIPKIAASANVIANVDAANKDEYMAALEKGVAHARGTYFPGQGKTIFMFAHSTDAPWNIARYNAVFYLLRKLEIGDTINVYFADHKYIYIVDQKFVTKANDTTWLNDKGLGERLVLQTCDPPGTSWNRLIVIAKPVKN